MTLNSTTIIVTIMKIVLKVQFEIDQKFLTGISDIDFREGPASRELKLRSERSRSS